MNEMNSQCTAKKSLKTKSTGTFENTTFQTLFETESIFSI